MLTTTLTPKMHACYFTIKAHVFCYIICLTHANASTNRSAVPTSNNVIYSAQVLKSSKVYSQSIFSFHNVKFVKNPFLHQNNIYFIYMKYTRSCLQIWAENLSTQYHSLFSLRFGALYPSLSSYQNYHPYLGQEESASCRYHVQTCISSQQSQVHLLLFDQSPTASALQSSLQAAQEHSAPLSQKRV